MTPSNEPQQLVAYPIAFMQAIANYLAERPYKEVVQFLDGIQRNGMPVNIPAPDPAPPPEAGTKKDPPP